METHKLLALSTAHLTPDICTGKSKSKIGEIAYPKGDYGWFVWVPGQADWQEMRGSFPVCLAECIEFAQKHGCGWLMFDRDADEIPELRSYDW